MCSDPVTSVVICSPGQNETIVNSFPRHSGRITPSALRKAVDLGHILLKFLSNFHSNVFQKCQNLRKKLKRDNRVANDRFDWESVKCRIGTSQGTPKYITCISSPFMDGRIMFAPTPNYKYFTLRPCLELPTKIPELHHTHKSSVSMFPLRIALS